ncbi:unnamed protein product [Jaminaea pallidilutea]
MALLNVLACESPLTVVGGLTEHKFAVSGHQARLAQQLAIFFSDSTPPFSVRDLSGYLNLVRTLFDYLPELARKAPAGATTSIGRRAHAPATANEDQEESDGEDIAEDADSGDKANAGVFEQVCPYCKADGRCCARVDWVRLCYLRLVEMAIEQGGLANDVHPEPRTFAEPMMRLEGGEHTLDSLCDRFDVASDTGMRTTCTPRRRSAVGPGTRQPPTLATPSRSTTTTTTTRTIAGLRGQSAPRRVISTPSRAFDDSRTTIGRAVQQLGGQRLQRRRLGHAPATIEIESAKAQGALATTWGHPDERPSADNKRWGYRREDLWQLQSGPLQLFLLSTVCRHGLDVADAPGNGELSPSLAPHPASFAVSPRPSTGAPLSVATLHQRFDDLIAAQSIAQAPLTRRIDSMCEMQSRSFAALADHRLCTSL